MGLPCGSNGKKSACKFRRHGFERAPGEGNGIPLQYSCLENPMDRVAWCVTVHRVAKSWAQLQQLSRHTCIYLYEKAQKKTLNKYLLLINTYLITCCRSFIRLKV